MVKKYIKNLLPYYMALSLLFSGTALAEIALGDSGVTLNGGVRLYSISRFAAPLDYGKKADGRYFTLKHYIRGEFNFAGKHEVEGLGNFIWAADNRFYTNTSTGVSLIRAAYIGLDTKFGEVIVGKFYTAGDYAMYYNTTIGDVFNGTPQYYITGTALDTGTNPITNTEKYNMAIQYSLPKLVEGFTMKVGVATDPNAFNTSEDTTKGSRYSTNTFNSTGENPSRALNSKYPFAVDVLTMYQHTTGLFALASYAEAHNLSATGGSLVTSNDDDDYSAASFSGVESTKRTGIAKVGYAKDALQVTAGYRHIFFKSTTKVVSTDGTNLQQTRIFSDAYIVGATYTMGAHKVGLEYETLPKASDNKLHALNTLYAYKANERVTFELLAQHLFSMSNTKDVDDKKMYGFVKNSVSELIGKVKFAF